MLAEERIELIKLRNENKELKQQLEALRNENMRLRSQLEARDTWLQQAGQKMISFGTDGRAGYWTNNLTKYLTEVSLHLLYHFTRERSWVNILRVPYLVCVT